MTVAVAALVMVMRSPAAGVFKSATSSVIAPVARVVRRDPSNLAGCGTGGDEDIVADFRLRGRADQARGGEDGGRLRTGERHSGDLIRRIGDRDRLDGNRADVVADEDVVAGRLSDARNERIVEELVVRVG